MQNKVLESYRDVFGEEETKTKLIEPFFDFLGYDVKEVEDVKTEATYDFGLKKEKVDYVLCIANIPKILVEAKDRRIELGTEHINQLYRYFCAGDCKLGILTNGLQYWFFSDFQKENIMDSQPFYKLNIFAPKPTDSEILTAICKVQQCAYPVEKYIAQKKAERFLRSGKFAELVTLGLFHDMSNLDAVQTAISGISRF